MGSGKSLKMHVNGPGKPVLDVHHEVSAIIVLISAEKLEATILCAGQFCTVVLHQCSGLWQFM